MADVTCIRCEQTRPEIEGSPYGGALGQDLKTKICNICWQEWYQHSIKLINEYKLSLRDQKGRDFLATQMKVFLELEPGSSEEAAKIDDSISHS